MATKLKQAAALAVALIAPAFARDAMADDIFKGMKGPTDWQVDERFAYSTNKKGVKTATDTVIVKGWVGGKSGTWASITFPAKFIDSPKGSNDGFGDVTMAFGPRGIMDAKKGKLHWLSYVSFTLPTGAGGKVPIGNDRVDVKVGGLLTYLTNNKKFEVDGAFENNFTGKNGKGINPKNEFYAGLVAGGAVGKSVRCAAGPTYLTKTNGDDLLSGRIICRDTISKLLHIEWFVDRAISGTGIPKANSIGIFARRNF